MKKQNLNQLKLNKKSISSLQEDQLNGGTGSWWTDYSVCYCDTKGCTDTECHTVWDCEL
ncbi:MAG: class I lanthipeptide [Kordia sp.]|uniref:class I lanthipeptide n=1 Tax=Kordia sp. TaxID=1965332 RepID=UPI00385B4AB3